MASRQDGFHGVIHHNTAGLQARQRSDIPADGRMPRPLDPTDEFDALRFKKDLRNARSHAASDPRYSCLDHRSASRGCLK